MTLSIVILSYNTLDLVLTCVSTLRKQYEKELEDKQVEIIVVDNASEKEVVDGVQKGLRDLAGVHLVKSRQNLGFGKGCNLGAKYSKGEFVLFLNSDTKTNDRGFLEMVNFLKDNPRVAILGGRLLNFDKTPQASAGKFYTPLNFYIMLFGGEKFGLLRSSPDNVRAVDWVSGACFMVNKEIFNELSGFDKNIFMYMEDMEICYRAKKNGFMTYYYPKVSVEHMQHGSSNRSFAIFNIYEGILYFYKKHKSNLEYQIVRLSLFIKALGVYFLGRLTNNSYYTKTYGQALEIFK